MPYEVPQRYIDRYADILINYGLNDGQGIKKGETVFLQVPECAKPMLVALYKTALKAGAHPLINYYPDDMGRILYELGKKHQLEFFPRHALKGKVKEMDHVVTIIADTDKYELEGIPPKKIMTRQRAFKPYIDWRTKKENEGNMTWTLALYGTKEMAKEVNMSLEEYWNEIIKACYLNRKKPVKIWKDIQKEVERIKKKLDGLEIEKLHVKSKSIDLWIKLGKNRKWLGASGKNIPSFEVFISPDWRGTEGYIQFTEPLYRYGSLIEEAYLKFEDGVVVDAKAKKGEKLLKEMIKTEGANKVGEFSLTDKRLSKITKFMGETLFDENVGGKYGNTHIALGKAYNDSYSGDISRVKKSEWKKMGYNDSVEHTDIVSTENRTVTAHLKDGKTKVIYKDGKFTV